jgi:hypothetical protein
VTKSHRVKNSIKIYPLIVEENKSSTVAPVGFFQFHTFTGWLETTR